MLIHERSLADLKNAKGEKQVWNVADNIQYGSDIPYNYTHIGVCGFEFTKKKDQWLALFQFLKHI